MGDVKDDNLLHKVSATNPGLVQSVQFGHGRENFIVFLEDEAQLNLYKYQGEMR